MMVYKDYVPTAERTLRILESVVASQSGLTATQLSNTLHIPRSAIYALLNTLIGLGYIEQDGPRKPYKPGSRLKYLNQPYPSGIDALIATFRAETLQSALEETYSLWILSGSDAVALAETPGKCTVRCVMPVGKREYAPTSPAGLILLAGLSQIDLAQTLIPLNDILENNLINTRRNIIVKVHQEDMMVLAAPICPDGKHPEAALMLCCPTFRWSLECAQYLTNSLHEVAARISYRLGANLYRPYAGIVTSSTGESVPMSQDELKIFLKGPWAARLACIRPDGNPHVVPVWYEEHNGSFIIVAWPNSVWATLVKANPMVALTIDEPWPPMRRVMIRGEANFIPNDAIPGGIEKLRKRISIRYLGTEYMPLTEANAISNTWSAYSITPKQCIALKQTLHKD